MDSAYIGAIVPWAGTYAPQGWLLCNGQSLQISQYQALYAVIGPQYGGDCRTYFNLPNLQGCFPIGEGTLNTKWGTVVFQQGKSGGSIAYTLAASNMPAHTHTATVSDVGVSASFGVRASTNAAEQMAPPSDGTSANFGLAGANDPDSGTNVSIYKDISNDSSVVKLKSYPCDVTSTGGTVTVDPSGSISPAPVSVLSPYQVVKYIICVEGLFPPRP